MPTVLLSLNVPFTMQPGQIVALPARASRIYSDFAPVLITQGNSLALVTRAVTFVDGSAPLGGRFLKNGEASTTEVIVRA